ncbi:MAG TPA: hydrogenase expression/formation protein HypE, partial [Planctomycetota bacterium]|nr:hydrogenase expression/formation protein HypE [Planctomycetota bacterium]
LSALEDQATVPAGSARLAFTTDAFVVRPLFFPGGDIGRLAVCGTVNDLAVGGARPRHLSAAFILEEGFPIDDLRRIAASMAAACREAGVRVVAGDTKVVDAGKGDGVFIATSGVGEVPDGVSLSVHAARPGDRILVSGPVGDHGAAILSVREGLGFESAIESDCAPVADLASALLEACPGTRLMRDPTRGGLTAVLHEIAAASGVGLRIDEEAVPVRPQVRGLCEVLGLDPLSMACEGRLVAVVPAESARDARAALASHAAGRDAALIGEVLADGKGHVRVRSVSGGERRLPLPAGEPLPRIC